MTMQLKSRHTTSHTTHETADFRDVGDVILRTRNHTAVTIMANNTPLFRRNYSLNMKKSLAVLVFGSLLILWILLTWTMWFQSPDESVTSSWYAKAKTVNDVEKPVEIKIPNWVDKHEPHISARTSIIIPADTSHINRTALVSNLISMNAASAPVEVADALYDIREIVVVIEDQTGVKEKMERAILSSRDGLKTAKRFPGSKPAPINLVLSSSSSWVQMVSDAVAATNGEYILIVTPQITRDSTSHLSWIRDVIVYFDDNPDVSFISPTISLSEGVYSAGIEFAASALKRGLREVTRPLLLEGYRRLHGVNVNDDRVKRSMVGVYPDPCIFAMRRQVWQQYGGGLGVIADEILSLVDVVLKWETEHSIVGSSMYLSTLPVMITSSLSQPIIVPGSAESVTNRMELDVVEFGRRWSGVIADELHDEKLRQTTVVWDSFCGCTGFGLETVSFAVALERIAPLQVIGDVDRCFCHGLGADKRPMTRMSEKRFEDVSIFISHKPAPNYPRWPYVGSVTIKRRPKYIVGRSMIETTELKRDWVIAIHNRVNEVWVPTKFMKGVFINGGVPKEKIQVIPIPFNVHLFNPSTVSRKLHKSLVKAGLEKHRDKFKFLSVFKWENRKGWDVLLRAYFSEFSADDPVVLVLQTYAYKSHGNPRDPKHIHEKIRDFARVLYNSDQDSGYDTEDYSRRLLSTDDEKIFRNLPAYVVSSDEFDAQDMPRLYQPMDAFVLPTRGEGWCMPVMEAMAMELPVIVTNFSGPTEYLTKYNSYPLNVEKMVRVTDKDVGIGKWAEPSQSHLQQLMRRVFNKKDKIKIGLRARQDVIEKYSRESVAIKVQSRLRDIAHIVEKVGFQSDDSDDE